jgi:hypothetical protein
VPSPRMRRPVRPRPQFEPLERRELLTAAAVPNVAMTSATTVNSRGVTIEYDVSGASLAQPLTFAVDRSIVPTGSSTDVNVGSMTFGPDALDNVGASIGAVGRHQLTIPLTGGLPPSPAKPFVVVVADPANTIAESNKSDDSASFHTDVIGVVTHGGVQPSSWKKLGPPWERAMAASLSAEGYDKVIAYNWVADSNRPGSAAKQAPRLVNLIDAAASQFPAGDVVDLHLIGHSEGAVVNSQVVLKLNQVGWPANLKAGYLKTTMLDPHAANNGVTAKQYDTAKGFLGWVARKEINAYQSKAHDPPVVVPANVNQAEVYYQHTPIKQATGSNGGIYNLWGQVPVHGEATYVNLTGPGVSHAGAFGVQNWYNLNVVPTLAEGSSVTVAPTPLTATEVATGDSHVLSAEGTAQPGARVSLVVEPKFVMSFSLFSADNPRHTQYSTTADASGHWRVTTPKLATGAYWVQAKARIHAAPSRPHVYISQAVKLPSFTTT